MQFFFKMVAASNNTISNNNNMSNIETLLQEFNNNATNDINKFLSALTDLLLLALSNEENLNIIAAGVNIDSLFHALSETKNGSSLAEPQNKSVLTDLCKLLRLVLSRIDPVNVFTKFGWHIVESVTEGTAEEYHLECINQIMRLADYEDYNTLTRDPLVFKFLIKGIGKPSLSVASCSRKIIMKVIEHDPSNDWLFLNENYKEVASLLEMKDATTKFRVYEIFIDMLKFYPEHLQSFVNHGSFDWLFENLADSNDVLSKLNALDIVTSLALVGDQGLSFILNKGIMTWLQSICESDDPLVQFLLPGAIKCFSVICTASPTTILPKYGHLMDFVYRNISEAEDPSLRCLCVETFSFMASKSDTLKELYKKPDALKESTEQVGRMISSNREDEKAKTKILEAISTIFDHHGSTTDLEISMICEKLFHHLSDDPVKFFMKFARQPFFGLRYGAMKVLCNVSKFSWIEQDFALCAGFLEYLLDRSTESEKEGRELKYSIINNLSISNTAGENLGAGFHNKILVYAKEGPFYAESHVAVTYEREN